MEETVNLRKRVAKEESDKKPDAPIITGCLSYSFDGDSWRIPAIKSDVI